MRHLVRAARINVRALIILASIVVSLGIGAFVLREARRGMIMRDALARGMDDFENERWDDACRQFRRYLEKDRANADVISKFAEAHLNCRPLEAENIEAAIWAYRLLMRIEPDLDQPYEVLAELYIATENSNELAYIARRRAERAPDDTRAPIWLATSLMSQHRLSEARESLERLESRQTAAGDFGENYLDACALLAAIEMQGDSPNRFEYALTRLNQAAARAPQSAYILTIRAGLYREQARTAAVLRDTYVKKAREDLEAAEATAPTHARDCLAICREWQELGDFERAGKWVQKLKEIPQEEVRRRFRDEDDWVVAVFLLEADLILRDDAARVDATPATVVLDKLHYDMHRARVAPTAVRMYVAGGDLDAAQRCLSEYERIIQTRGASGEAAETATLLRAYSARAEGKPFEVIALLHAFINRDPSDSMALKLLADAYQATGQDRLAARALQGYMARLGRSADPDAAVRLARSYLHAWRLGEAARLAASVEAYSVEAALIRIEAELLEAQLRGVAAFATAAPKATAELQSLQAQYPECADIALLQAAIACQKGDRQQAERILTEAVGRYDNATPIETALVRLYLSVNKQDQALETARRARDRRPEEPVGWLTLAGVHEAFGQGEEAAQVYEAALLAVPEDAVNDVALCFAIFELDHGQRPAGVERLQAIAVAEPADIRVRSILLELPEILADEQSASRLIGEIKAVEGENGRMYRVHQAAFWLAGDQWRAKEKEIRESLESLLTTDPGLTPAVLALGDLYERLDRADDAVQLYERALAADPSSSSAADRLLDLLHRLHRYAEARRVLSRLRDTAVVDVDRGATIVSGAADLDQLVADLRRRMHENPADAAARTRLAWLTYERSKNVEEAMAFLDEAESDQLVVSSVRAAILEDAGRMSELRAFLDEQVARDESFEAYQLRATFLYRIGDFTAVERDCRRLLTFDDRPEAFLQAGMFYADTGRLDEALEIWESGLNRRPFDYALKTRVMTGLLERGRAEDQSRAVALLDELAELKPRDPQLLGVRALLVLRDGAPGAAEEAEKLLLQAVEGRPTAVEAHMKLIQLALNRGDPDAARRRAEQALEINPDAPTLLLAAAELEALSGDMTDAISRTRTVLDRDPGNADALNLFAQFAAGAGDRATLEEGKRLLERALTHDSPDVRLYLDMSIVLAALDETGEALAILDGLPADAEPRHLAAAASQRVGLYARRMEFDRIVALLEEQAALLQSAPETLVHAGMSLMTSVDAAHRQAGRQALDDGMQQLPLASNARLDGAGALYKQGDVAAAAGVYEAFLTADPSNARACNDYAWILSEERGEYDRALELAGRGLETARDALRQNLLDTRGVIFVRLGRLAEAREDFEELTRSTPTDSSAYARALLQLARVCALQDDGPAAERALRIAVSVDRRLDVFAPAEREEILRLMDAHATGAR